MRLWPIRHPGLAELCLVLAGGAGCGRATSGDSRAASEADGPAGAEGSEAESPIELGAGPWLGSFETGLYADERLWLLSASGVPVLVMNPALADDGIVSESSLGYLDEQGQIAQAVFDVVHERLLVTANDGRSRVTRALDLGTGNWSSLPPSELRNTAHGPVLLSLEGDVLSVLAAGDEPEFERVARVQLDPELTSLGAVAVQRHVVMGTERLLVVHGGGGAPRMLLELERTGGAWRPAAPLTPSRGDTAFIEVYEPGSRACVVGVDGSASIIERLSAVQSRVVIDAPFAVERCSFSPDGSRVAFSGRSGLSGLRVTNLGGLVLADFAQLSLQTNHGDFAYGTDGPNLIRFNWMSFALERLPSPRGWCAAPLFSGDPEEDRVLFHSVAIVGTTALVEAFCPTIDSRHSGVYLLPIEGAAPPRTLLEPGFWDILQIAGMADGSALIAQLPSGGEELPDAGDRFLRVLPDGSVQELGPFGDMPVPLHAPVGNVSP